MRSINHVEAADQVNKRSVVLDAKAVVFYSQHDEDAFFEWLSKLQCVEEYRGIGRVVRIRVALKLVTDDALRELLALFFRYRIEMTQLSIFETKSNRSWFAKPGSYWYRKTFVR